MADIGFLAQDWPAISQRLDEALALAPEQRAAWLGSLNDTDSVKAKLHALLFDAEGVETDDFAQALPRLTLGPAVSSATGDPLPDTADDAVQAGALVGPYRLIRELGVGGMGLVWLAERVDAGLKRQVALKLPWLHWSRDLAERLNRERDILVSLDDPHIARIHDAGVDAQGRPYLALEYVEGQALDVYCKARALPIPARLRLVLQVARAVAHAHARVVVHRDLKPANILVTDQGEVRLLDFGIAKLMEGDRTRETQLTAQAGRALTLDYASPEQIRGEPIGTASDVYSLGVVAYELMAQAKPYKLKRQSALALEDAIASVDVRQASSAAQGAEARRALKGDLDAILNKALKKNPAERYATADALIVDIEAHLGNRPVQAQPDRFGYRAGEFLRRNRWPVAAGSIAALTLMVSTSVALWQAHAADQQRDRALALLTRNEAINQFLGLFITEAAQSNRTVNLSEMLTRSETLADKEFQDAPESRAVVLAMLAMHRRTLGEGEKAEALINRALESARGSSDASLKATLTCQRATVLEIRGRFDEARRDLTATAARSDIDAEAAVQCLTYLAHLAQNLNDGPAAVDSARRALKAVQASQRASPSQTALLTGDLAYGLHLSGRIDEAGREFAASLHMFEQLGRGAGAQAISIRNNWGLVSLGSGDVKTAAALYGQIVSLLTGNGEEPPSYVLANWARSLEVSGRYGEAAKAYSQALAAAEKAGNQITRAFALLGLTSLAIDSGSLAEARGYLKQVEQMDASARPTGGPVAQGERIVRGRLALAQNELALARREFSAALARRSPNSSTISALLGRAQLGLREGQLALAEADSRDALQLAQPMQGGTPWSVRTGLAWLTEGEIRARSGNTAGAQEASAAAVDHLGHSVDASHLALQRARKLADSRVAVSVN